MEERTKRKAACRAEGPCGLLSAAATCRRTPRSDWTTGRLDDWWRRSFSSSHSDEARHVGKRIPIALRLNFLPQATATVTPLFPAAEHVGLVGIQDTATPLAPMALRGWPFQLEVTHDRLSTHPQAASDLMLLQPLGMQRADLGRQRDFPRVPLLTRLLLSLDPTALGAAPATIGRGFSRRSRRRPGGTGGRRPVLLHRRGGTGGCQGLQGLRCLGTCWSFAEQERL
jgi:hypothetical protein